MKPSHRAALSLLMLTSASFVWCAEAYVFRLRNNSPNAVTLQIMTVSKDDACGTLAAARSSPVRSGDAHELVCPSADGTAGFCLRTSDGAEWLRLDCIDRPRADAIELNLFGR